MPGNLTNEDYLPSSEAQDNILPDLDNTYDLGSLLQRWKNIYSVNGRFTNIYAGSTININKSSGIVPIFNITETGAGGTLQIFQTQPTTGTVNYTIPNVSSGAQFMMSNSNQTVTGSWNFTGNQTFGTTILPDTNGGADIGSNSLYFGNAYIQNLTLSTSLVPNTNGTINVGSSSNKFANGYINNIWLANTGGSQESLSHYETLNHTLELSGPFNSTSVSCRLIRVGKLVTMEIGSNSSTIPGNNTSTYISNPGFFLPSRFRPGTEIRARYADIQENGNNVQCVYNIYTTGEIRIFKWSSSPSSNTFIATTGNFLIYRTSMSWIVS